MLIATAFGARFKLINHYTHFKVKVISGAVFLQANFQKNNPIESISFFQNRMQNNIPRLRGFTLIEILVVLVIIGLMLTTAVIKAFPDERQTLRQEADRLGLLLEQARDEAFLSGHSVAWSIQHQTYTFWRLNAQRRWSPITGNQTLRLRTLPATISLTELTINAVKVPVGEHLIFSPSGLNTPFVATLELHAHHVHLLGDSAGQVQVKDEN